MRRDPGRRPSHTRGRVVARRLGIVCAGVALLLLRLLIVLPGGPSAPVAHAAPVSSPPPTFAPTATATPIPAPTLTLVSPSSRQGPAGARLTLAGAHWTVSGVTIGVAFSAGVCGTPASWEQTIGFAASPATGAFVYTFTWPTSLPPIATPYAVCAFATGLPPAAVAYQVRSALPPSLSLSEAVVSQGQSITVSGANFFGAPSVDVTLTDPTGAPRALGKQIPAADGSFALDYTPKQSDVGLVMVIASSPVEGGAPPALEASVTVNVQPTLTPTTSPQPTVTPIVTPTVAPLSSVPHRPTVNLMAVLAVALTLALLALAGAAFVIFFRLRAERQREAAQALRARTRRLPVAAGMAGDLDADTDPSMLATGSHLTTRRYAAADDDSDDGYDEVEWDDSEGPGPDWRPRPMTGSGPLFDESYPHAPEADESASGAAAVAPDEEDEETDNSATVLSNDLAEDDSN